MTTENKQSHYNGGVLTPAQLNATIIDMSSPCIRGTSVRCNSYINYKLAGKTDIIISFLKSQSGF